MPDGSSGCEAGAHPPPANAGKSSVEPSFLTQKVCLLVHARAVLLQHIDTAFNTACHIASRQLDLAVVDRVQNCYQLHPHQLQIAIHRNKSQTNQVKDVF
jgi:hypothetical protein